MQFQFQEVVALMALMGTLAFLFLALYLRYQRGVMHHKERLIAMEKGTLLPDAPAESPKRPFTPRVYLLRGLLWLFVGLSISLVLLSISFTTNHPPDLETQSWRVRSMRANGASEELVKQYLANPAQDRAGMPFGVASIGLIPISVGAAYLLFYKKETQV